MAPILFLTHEQEERALRIDRLRVLPNPWIIVRGKAPVSARRPAELIHRGVIDSPANEVERLSV